MKITGEKGRTIVWIIGVNFFSLVFIISGHWDMVQVLFMTFFSLGIQSSLLLALAEHTNTAFPKTGKGHLLRFLYKLFLLLSLIAAVTVPFWYLSSGLRIDYSAWTILPVLSIAFFRSVITMIDRKKRREVLNFISLRLQLIFMSLTLIGGLLVAYFFSDPFSLTAPVFFVCLLTVSDMLALRFSTSELTPQVPTDQR